MKETGMLFNGAMVRALLDGRKTQTRRIVKGQEFWGADAVQAHQMDSGVWRIEGAKQINAKLHDNAVTFVDVKCPFGKVGDRIWVRETWGNVAHSFNSDGDISDWTPDRPAKPINELPYGGCYYHGHVIYRADGEFEWSGDDDGDGEPRSAWHPSIHMPRAACRILLEITDIRIERLQDISEADAIAEGLAAITKDGKLFKHGIPDLDGLPGQDNHGWAWSEWEVDPRKAFKKIWESTGGNWNANPWVWVIEFIKLEA